MVEQHGDGVVRCISRQRADVGERQFGHQPSDGERILQALSAGTPARIADALEKAHLAVHFRRDSRACIQPGDGVNRRALAGNVGKTAAERIVLCQRRRIAERGDASDGIAHQGRIDVLRRGQHAVNAAVDRY